MTEDLTTLPPATFFRLAVERGGLDLEEVLAGLSPEAAEALRHIAAPATPTPPPPSSRGTTRSAPALEVGYPKAPGRQANSDRTRSGSPDISLPRSCPACGRNSHSGDRFCRRCGQQLGGQQLGGQELDRPVPFVTLDDLVAQGRLTREQAEEAENALLEHQRHYPAGTRYSVFGDKQ